MHYDHGSRFDGSIFRHSAILWEHLQRSSTGGAGDQQNVAGLSIRDMQNIEAGHVIDCALAGADLATVPYSVLEQMAKHPLTDAGIENKRRKPGLAHGECGSSG